MRPVQAEVRAQVTDDGAVTSVVAAWNGGASTVALVPVAGTNSWVATIGPYPAGGSGFDTVRVQATDDDTNTAAAIASLPINACPS